MTSEAVEFRAPCAECRADLERVHHERGPHVWSVGLRAAVVEGTLRREADVGFATCRRGHRVVVRRAASPVHLVAVGR